MWSKKSSIFTSDYLRKFSIFFSTTENRTLWMNINISQEMFFYLLKQWGFLHVTYRDSGIFRSDIKTRPHFFSFMWALKNVDSWGDYWSLSILFGLNLKKKHVFVIIWAWRKRKYVKRKATARWSLLAFTCSLHPLPLRDRMSVLTLSFLQAANESGRILSGRQMVSVLIKF